MKVPFLDIPAQNASIWDELQAALDPVMRGAQFILGPATGHFEQALAEYVGTSHCVGLNSGTSALHMALLACDIGPGDEVITTAHTWISTAWAISYVGATPVFVDIDPATYNLDPELVERAITQETKAILPVHLYGQAADMGRLTELAEANSLALIEDAAQAHGARIAGRIAGSLGKIGCFSFYPGKNLGAFGEGGAIVTDDAQLADRIRRLRDHAQDGRHNHVEIGYNTRMEGIQGAVLSVKLGHLDEWNTRRRAHAAQYCELLQDTAGVQLPASPLPDAHVWHLFVVLARQANRELLQTQLREQGVASGVHYPTPVPLQSAYAHLGYREGDFPVAQDVMSHCISLPMFPELTAEQIEYTAQTLKNCLASSKAS